MGFKFGFGFGSDPFSSLSGSNWVLDLGYDLNVSKFTFIAQIYHMKMHDFIV